MKRTSTAKPLRSLRLSPSGHSDSSFYTKDDWNLIVCGAAVRALLEHRGGRPDLDCNLLAEVFAERAPGTVKIEVDEKRFLSFHTRTISWRKWLESPGGGPFIGIGARGRAGRFNDIYPEFSRLLKRLLRFRSVATDSRGMRVLWVRATPEDCR